MYIIDYRYIHGTEERPGYIAIPELSRTDTSVHQFIELAKLNIVLDKPTAFIYVDGFSVSQSEAGIKSSKTCSKIPAIKSAVSYTAHEWAYTFENKEHLQKVDITSGTCASGIQALYEANRLLNDGIIQEVIIIGGERITDFTMKAFKEMRIPITCGDGFFYMKVSNNNGKERKPQVNHIEWKYKYENNPFLFSRETIDTLTPAYPVDFIKLHGTGTTANTVAEAGLSEIAVPITFKHVIGHTQGVSSLLETCIMLDNPTLKGTIMVTANGFGGYYGAFALVK